MLRLSPLAHRRHRIESCCCRLRERRDRRCWGGVAQQRHPLRLSPHVARPGRVSSLLLQALGLLLLLALLCLQLQTVNGEARLGELVHGLLVLLHRHRDGGRCCVVGTHEGVGEGVKGEV